MSPTAQRPSPARSRSLSLLFLCLSSLSTVWSPRPARFVRRPIATSSFSARSSSLTTNPPSYRTRSALASRRTSMPSASKVFLSSALDSGSSSASSRGAASTTVTRLPNRANTWASSLPIAPPPRTISDSGSSLASMASRFVQYGVPLSPSIGGVSGAVPVASTTPRRARKTSSPTVPSFGPVKRPLPRTSRPPLSVNRFTAASSFQAAVTSSTRSVTCAQSDVISAVPASPGIRRPSASTSDARTMALLGIHPQYGHSHPARRSSPPPTLSPACASLPTTTSTPGPIPMTTSSTSMGQIKPKHNKTQHTTQKPTQKTTKQQQRSRRC